MRFKTEDLSLQSLAPQLVLALWLASDVYEKEYGTELTVTSVNDGAHSINSLHYSGNAADLRIWNLPDETNPADVVSKIKSKLTRDFDVVLEKDHIHLEYQPKKP